MGDHGELVLATTLVLATGAMAWLVMAGPLNLWTRAAVRFAVSNALLAISLQLVLRRTPEPDSLAWPLADLCGLLAFFLLHGGIRHFFGMRPWHAVELLWIVLLLGAYWWLPPALESRLAYRTLYSLTAGVLSGVMSWQLWQGARREIDPRAAPVFALPFAGVSLLMAWRLLQLWLAPVRTEPIGADGADVVWAVFALCVLVNMSLASCLLTRLVLMMRRQAERDPLTGLYNRRFLQLRLAEERARSLRRPQPFALVMLDIDHFKQVNDKHGHAAGDAALKHVACTLHGLLRKSDVLARSGGEEFVVLMPETPASGAALVAERMRAALEFEPLNWDGQMIPVRASFGVADSGQAAEDDALLQAADRALYAAKAGGRNRVVLA